MPSSETWAKSLHCPLCDRKGEARLSHVDDPADDYGYKTIVEDCPEGFRVQQDEDDSYIVRFYCAEDNIPADQGL